MYTEQSILEQLKADLKPSRLEHTLGVVATAEAMAKHYRENAQKARLAALLHDCSRINGLSVDEMAEIASRSAYAERFPQFTTGENLLHAAASEVLARERYGVEDGDVLDAIRWHTTGRHGLGRLGIIVYCADMIEPERRYPGVEKLRAIGFDGLWELALECCGHTVEYLESTGSAIHPATLEFYEYLKGKYNG